MKQFLLLLSLALLSGAQTDPLRLIEVDPGHSHLSGLHARTLPGVSDEVHLYSPLSPEMAAHLLAIARYNHRATDPTHWTMRVFAGPDFLAQMRREPPGAVVALSGRNDTKIDYIEAALQTGQHVFADKPWIINEQAFPRLEKALQLAQEKRLVTYDWMTLRAETPYRLVRDLVGDGAVFGTPAPGSVEQPAVRLENLHALLKFSGGVAQQRPASAVDVRQQGEGMADVGTHLADLAQWTLFPGQAISYKKDIKVLQADHTPLYLTLDQFTRLTSEAAWPAYLQPDLVDGKLKDYANGTCVYTLRGVHVHLKVGWQYQAPPGAQDSYFASFQGTRSRIELRAGPAEKFIPQIYVISTGADLSPALTAATTRLGAQYPKLSFEKTGDAFHVILPAAERGGGSLQSLFAQFAGYVRQRDTFPAFENANLLAKYYVTTKAVAMANGRK